MGRAILVVEDDAIQARNISAYLIRQGWEVETCASAEDGLRVWETLHPDAVVTDQRFRGLSGIEMLQKMHKSDPHVKCIVMTGDDSAQTAVQAMKAGAYDYVIKPLVLAELHLLLERAIGAARMEQALQFHQERQADGAGVASILGESPAIKSLQATLRHLLDTERRIDDGDLPAVLITGETGTGKELVARSLHFDGPRSRGPFVEINCASIPSHLLESELFGHEKGAFTDAKERRTGLIEAADGGTLFLDEIGEVEPSLQAKLLKLLEEKTIRRIGAVKERKVDLRIISATNRDLEAMVRQGRFRSDLYFRLRIVSIVVPALRARGDDILLLARHFLAAHGRRYGKPALRFSAEAEHALAQYFWPGNVRELRNMLQQTVLLAHGDVVTPGQLALCTGLAPAPTMSGDVDAAPPAAAVVPRNWAELQNEERTMVVRTLERTGWNVTKSARMLGLSRDMMRYRIEKLGLSRPPEDSGTLLPGS
ncbi:MAG TPA: sigma-54 dependent transcriptional regulator [Ramlibacter sp.]|uniref:sigma-54-dependent transcriptional regulator n=1 Tax=Ramlibacter sp. TaxID=1917967 RepID=UPI002ED4002C